ncbi:MAG: PEP-CTERM sorting domain-containing protein, partial [Verrucomicrobiaceae bacterium]
SGVSNYTGATTVNGGTLQLNVGSGTGSLAGNGPIVINGGGNVASGAVDGLGFYNPETNNGITINEGGTLTALEGGRLSMDRVLTSIGGTITSLGTNFDSQASYAFRFRGDAGDPNAVPPRPADPANSYNFTSSPGGVASTISATHIGVDGAVFNVTKGGGAIDLNVTGDIVDKFGTNGLRKDGDGVMVIANAENPLLTGPTIVDEGTLLVNGSITNSTVTVNDGILGGIGGTLGITTVTADGILAPGPLIGTLNFSKSLTLEGTAIFEINKTGSLLTADLANVTGALTLGGNLTVTATGAALVSGDTFNLFDSLGGFSGNFASLNLPTLNAGLSWQTSSLPVDGTLSVVPEPGAVFSLLAGAGMMLGLRRRRAC